MKVMTVSVGVIGVLLGIMFLIYAGSMNIPKMFLLLPVSLIIFSSLAILLGYYEHGIIIRIFKIEPGKRKK